MQLLQCLKAQSGVKHSADETEVVSFAGFGSLNTQVIQVQ